MIVARLLQPSKGSERMAKELTPYKHNTVYFTLKLKADTEQHFCKLLLCVDQKHELCPDM